MSERTVWRLQVKDADKLVTRPSPYIAKTRDEAIWYANTHGGGLADYDLTEITETQWHAEMEDRARGRSY